MEQLSIRHPSVGIDICPLNEAKKGIHHGDSLRLSY